MKLKSFIAGAAGVFLFFAGQNLGAQESAVPAPDRSTSTLPAPDRDSSTLPAPDQEASRIPSPDPVKAPDQAPPASAGLPSAPGTEAPRSARAQPDSGSAGREAASSATPAAPRRRWPGSLPSRGLYLGATAGLTTPKYDTDDTDWENYGSADGRLRGAFGLFLGLDFGPLIGEIGTVLSFDRAKVYYSGYYDGYYDGRSARAVALHVPLLVKMDFHLGPVVLQPLLGPYFNFALGDLRIDSARDPYANPLFGLVFGGLAGLNLGRGILFIDGRYEMDLGRTVAGNDPITIWSRSAFILSLGYQIYLGRRR